MRRTLGWTILLGLSIGPGPVLAQGDLVVRTPPPPLEDFETDADGDGVADGWYNIQDARLVKGGVVGPTCLRFENAVRGLPARASRAFGVDGEKYEAVVIGLWIRAEDVRHGDRLGTDPTLLVDFLGENIKSVRRGSIGPWSKTPRNGWLRVASRLPVPPTTRDAILTVGLMGATGVLEIDGVTFDLVPRGGRKSTNLILNGGFELGSPSIAAHWTLEGAAHRVSPGHQSDAAVELTRDNARAIAALGVPAGAFGAIELSASVSGQNLRQGSPGAQAAVYFLDDDGQAIAGRSGSALAASFKGSFGWSQIREVVDVPAGAEWVAIQFEHLDGPGTLKIDDVSVVASPNREVAAWTPYQVRTEEADDWPAFAPSSGVEPGSALDASALVPSPAGKSGFVAVKNRHLCFQDGSRARFFGVVSLPPLAFAEPERADSLADRLARSGVNLVRFDDLDTALGPGRSLIDDARDDTKVLDPASLGRFDHLVAALKARGIYVSIEIQAARIYRDGDGLPDASAYPLGGGPSYGFDPRLRGLAVDLATQLLGHVNPETKLPLKDDPVLAWVVISGQQSLFDQVDNPDAMPAPEKALLAKIAEKRPLGTGARLWHVVEGEQWKAIADDLRRIGVKVPIAGCSHWRREPDFVAAQAVSGLDLIDDRLYWPPPPFGSPDRRSMLYQSANPFLKDSARKQKPDRPYVVGQWASHTSGAWALPFEGADLLLTARLAADEDWDALARRGLFQHPEIWGRDAAGTGGDRDVFAVPEALNGIPPVYSLLPHAASIFLRPEVSKKRTKSKAGLLDPRRGRLVVETAHTLAIAGWSGRQGASADGLTLKCDSNYGVIAVSSLGLEPLSEARRLLVSAVARVEPTGLRWADNSRRSVADPGVAPLRREPIRGSVAWKTPGAVRAFALDEAGKRGKAIPLARSAEGFRLDIGGDSGVHWELVSDAAEGRGPP